MAKSLLRVNKPIVIALSTNDALGGNFKNMGMMMDRKNIFFVPLGQDDHVKKPYSLVADLKQAIPTLQKALDHEQIQPLFTQF